MPVTQYTFSAPCLFGLESILAGEVRRIGGGQVQVTDGKVAFQGDLALMARANLCLRTAERVGIVLGTFSARTFDELFEGTRKLPFEQFIGRSDAFPVKGWSLKSQLHSIPDCQKIVKRAVVKRFEGVYNQTWFEETGPVHQIQFSLFKDMVTVSLDTSGPGLHKRGYRRESTLAPIKETLAAGIVDLARIRADSVVCDPMCGSGTLLIEAGLRAFHIPPGARRRFAAEGWDSIGEAVWQEERGKALEEITRGIDFTGIGRDIDPAAVTLSTSNAAKAGLGKKMEIAAGDIKDFEPPENSIVLCNPPYGERLLEIKEAESLYRTLGRVLAHREDISVYIISPHEQFEEFYGRRADRRRKLYNGMIKCQLFQYSKKK